MYTPTTVYSSLQELVTDALLINSGVLAIKLTKELANNDPYAQFTGEVCEFDDSELGLSVQYVTGMKLYMRRWDGRKVIGGKWYIILSVIQ